MWRFVLFCQLSSSVSALVFLCPVSSFFLVIGWSLFWRHGPHSTRPPPARSCPVAEHSSHVRTFLIGRCCDVPARFVGCHYRVGLGSPCPPSSSSPSLLDGVVRAWRAPRAYPWLEGAGLNWLHDACVMASSCNPGCRACCCCVVLPCLAVVNSLRLAAIAA